MNALTLGEAKRDFTVTAWKVRVAVSQSGNICSRRPSAIASATKTSST